MASNSSTSQKHLIIGAGFVGLGMAKAMRRFNLPYDQVEATSAIGGNWKHGVYPHVHIISSKKTTEYPDYPMPDTYSDFPSAGEILSYLKSYAKHFQLEESIEFEKTVTSVIPNQDQTWQVTFKDGESRQYKGVLVCNGHHWNPKHPEFEGSFSGTYLHSKEYRDESILKDKRVLVIGGGNSAVDIACDGARVATQTDLSLKEGIWFLPKTVFGKPIVDQMRPFVPTWLQRIVMRVILRIVIGPYERYGLPQPTHKLFTKHPTVSTQVLHFLTHGRIKPRPQVVKMEGDTVSFSDGSQSNYDVVVGATGYHVSFPFLPEGLVPIKGPIPQLPEGAFHPKYRGLYIVGWAQVRYGVGPLITKGAPSLCQAIKIQDQLRHPIGALLVKLGRKTPSSHLIDPMKAMREYRRAMWTLKLLPMIERFLLKKPPAALTETWSVRAPQNEVKYF